MQMKGRVLIVAGSDSSGGTGIQADIKTVTALGAYAMTAVTTLTARDTLGVVDIHPVPADFVQRQMRLAIADIGVDVIHIGMLHTAELVNAVADVIEEMAPDVPLVLDPVIVTKAGRSLLDQNGLRHLKIRLLPRATVLTPNLREAELLGGLEIPDFEARRHAAEMLLTLGAKAILLKGGYDMDKVVIDLLATEDGIDQYMYDKIETRHLGGVGSTLSAGVATGIAQGLSIRDSVTRARAYLQEAILQAPGLGGGAGPINHAVTVRDLQSFYRTEGEG